MCYPNGPPPSTCMTLFPKHGVERQTGQSPFMLTLSQETYAPGQNITVEVEGNGNSIFVGFQVTAHRVESSGNTEEFIGMFTPSNASRSQVISCLGQPGKMWAHKDNFNKTKMTATWTAPNSNLGDLEFFLTVVQHKLMFWHRIPTSLQAAGGDVVAPEHMVPKVTVPTSLSPMWTACGESKGCWLVPESGKTSCDGTDCQAAISYKKQGNLFEVEMAVKGQDNYISVGFSGDKMMGDDQTVSCTANMGHESVQVGYNPGKYNDRQFTMGISNLTVGQVNGQAYCRFTCEASLTIVTETGGSKTFNLNNEFYLFLAWGHVHDGTDVIGKHSDAPAISSKMIDLKVIVPTSAASRTAICNIVSLLFVALSLLLKTW
ncbi:putative ferric-chelate reductase 1 [Littorina saxatilis]|uniref:Reelin domain-containing protein n=1 Tax=Littorina saxatilis TaxID=31220 RepID=A0AAN9BR80_9CAEN